MWRSCCAWPRVSLFSALPCLPFISRCEPEAPGVIGLDDPDEAPRSPALPGMSRMPWADARPTPAISATVPINIVFTLRFIVVPLWSLFRDGSAVTFNQEETDARAITFPD